jgi:hypothetical protein
MLTASLSYAQTLSDFRGFQGTNNMSNATIRTGFRGNSFGLGYSSGFSRSVNPMNSALQANLGNYGAASPRRTGMGSSYLTNPGLTSTVNRSSSSTGGLSPLGGYGNSLSLTNPYRSSNLYASGANTGQPASSSNILTGLSPLNQENQIAPFYSGLESPILIPDQKADITETYQREWMVSAQQAVAPVQISTLNKPTKIEGVSPPDFLIRTEESSNTTASLAGNPEVVGSTTLQGSYFSAQQIAKARTFIRQNQYQNALACYMSVQTVDPKNINALVGTIFCHLMSNRLLSGGLNVLRLSELEPNFWQQQPDFNAVFGQKQDQIVRRLQEVEPEIDIFLSIHGADTNNETADAVKKIYLAKMIIAWFKDDTQTMKTSITDAMKASPLDQNVYQLYASISGKPIQETTKLEPIKPIN